MAHELKTPLTALLLVGDSLASQVNSRHAVLVERLQRELLRLQLLVGDLLELSRLENALPGDRVAAIRWIWVALVEGVGRSAAPGGLQRRIELALHGRRSRRGRGGDRPRRSIRGGRVPAASGPAQPAR